MDYTPTERAVTSRNASTANLAIDSRDRTRFSSNNLYQTLQPFNSSSTDFTIALKQNIMTGFFTRLAVNEVCLNWSRPNIIAGVNNEFIIRISTTNTSVLLDGGYYTVAEALDAIVIGLNTALGAATFSITQPNAVPGSGVASLTKAAGSFCILNTPLAYQLGFQLSSSTTSPPVFNFGTSFPAWSATLLNTPYIDFVCNNLTYCQNVKDSTTSQNSQDILYRWNFAWDDRDSGYDTYGYPILQGYKAFCARRAIPFPKQILWDNIQPIGQLSFQIYGADGLILYQPVPILNDASTLSYGEIEFSINLLVSEV
jgi:hypothetical protein